MSEQNLRMVVVGAPRADREYGRLVTDREGVKKTERALVKELEAVERELRREISRAKRARGG